MPPRTHDHLSGHVDAGKAGHRQTPTDMPMGLSVGLSDEMGGEDVLTRAAVGLVFAVAGAGAAVAVSGVPHEVGGLAAVDVGNGTVDADVA
jgi:hypothetical protein